MLPGHEGGGGGGDRRASSAGATGGATGGAAAAAAAAAAAGAAAAGLSGSSSGSGEPLRIFVGTWNCNARGPPTPSVINWLLYHIDPLPDIYVVGFQEIVTLNAKHLANDAKSTKREAEWTAYLGTTLNQYAEHVHKAAPPDLYARVRVVRMVGILLLIYVKNKHTPHLKGIVDKTVACGIMNVAGNKGAAVCRLQLYDTTFCFVCAHMSAHRKQVDARNKDYHHIIDSIGFRVAADDGAAASAQSAGRFLHSTSGGSDCNNADFPAGDGRATQSTSDGAATVRSAAAATGGVGGMAPGANHGRRRSRTVDEKVALQAVRSRGGGDDGGGGGGGSSSSSSSKGTVKIGIMEHDFVFWLGDLNYRMDESIDIQTVYQKIKLDDLKYLKNFDQLTRVSSEGKVQLLLYGCRRFVLRGHAVANLLKDIWCTDYSFIYRLPSLLLRRLPVPSRLPTTNSARFTCYLLVSPAVASHGQGVSRLQGRPDHLQADLQDAAGDGRLRPTARG